MVTRIYNYSLENQARIMMDHTVLVRPSSSECCKCGSDTALPSEGSCRECGTAWRFMMSDRLVSEPQLMVLATDLELQFPNLTFAGIGDNGELMTPYSR
jgi:hypothetical protein